MKHIVDRFLSQKAKLHLEVPGEVAVVGVPEEEGQEADLGVGQEEGQGVDRVVGLEVKNSHCMGMSTESDAIRQLSVSSPSEGGQSIMI